MMNTEGDISWRKKWRINISSKNNYYLTRFFVTLLVRNLDARMAPTTHLCYNNAKAKLVGQINVVRLDE